MDPEVDPRFVCHAGCVGSVFHGDLQVKKEVKSEGNILQWFFCILDRL
jgi:hypothetical protein